MKASICKLTAGDASLKGEGPAIKPMQKKKNVSVNGCFLNLNVARVKEREKGRGGGWGWGWGGTAGVT